MNYNLMVANCKCNSNAFQEEENNRTIIAKPESGMGRFDSLTNTLISNLIDFNFEVIRCYNLVFNKEILLQNIGFFCLSIMLILQIIFFFVYLIIRVEPIKIFMMIFNDIKKINKKYIYNHNKNSPPKKNKHLDNSFEINKKSNKIFKNRNYINKKKEKLISKNNETSNEENNQKKENIEII